MKVVVLSLLLLLYAQANLAQSRTHNSDSVLSDHYNRSFIKAHPNLRESEVAYWYLLLYGKDKSSQTHKTICLNMLKLEQRTNVQNNRHTYTQILHYSCDTLSKMYYTEKKYDSSLYYLYQMDTVYRYNDGCANGIYARLIEIACRKANVYLKIGQRDSAISTLLYLAFLEETDRHLKLLKNLFANEDKEKLKAELNTAVDHYEAISADKGHYFILFRNVAMKFGHPLETSDGTPLPQSKSEIIAHVHKKEFYKMVMSL